jgi:deazaflavin-dependent oxidoreductase (nitroreductase family)
MHDITIPEGLPNWIREHAELYLRDGAAAHDWDSTPVGGDGICSTLLLVTIGRKSGRKLGIPLVYQNTGSGSYCIVASKGGSHRHPEWYLNLVANPKVEIRVGSSSIDVAARVAHGPERERLWKLLVSHGDTLRKYQERTEREIPVVVLEPVKTGA